MAGFNIAQERNILFSFSSGIIDSVAFFNESVNKVIDLCFFVQQSAPGTPVTQRKVGDWSKGGCHYDIGWNWLVQAYVTAHDI